MNVIDNKIKRDKVNQKNVLTYEKFKDQFAEEYGWKELCSSSGSPDVPSCASHKEPFKPLEYEYAFTDGTHPNVMEYPHQVHPTLLLRWTVNESSDRISSDNKSVVVHVTGTYNVRVNGTRPIDKIFAKKKLMDSSP